LLTLFLFTILIISCCIFFLYRYCDLRDLHSFPTRRSSDLHAVWNVVRDLRPRFPVIRGLIGERIAIVHLMEIHRDVCRSRVVARSEEHTSELQSPYDLVCRLLLEKKKKKK